MRIVFVINSLIYGGAESQLISLARELVRRGHDVSIYTLMRKNERLKDLDGSGVSVVQDQKRLKLDLALVWRLRRHLKWFRADIVQGFLFDGNVYAAMAALGTGIPALGSERSDDYRINLNQKAAIWVCRYWLAAVVANSHSGAQFARRLFGLAEEKVHVVWNGIDVGQARLVASSAAASVREMFNGSDVKVACLIGNLRPAKDYLLALNVADCLTGANPNWRVLFVGGSMRGEADYAREVMSAWRQLRLQGRSHFAGLRKDVLEIMAQCDVVFSTSVREGFPNVVLEAMAVGTPVVSTQYSDIQDILPAKWQIVRSRSAAEISAAIVRADRERERLIAEQHRWVEAHASIGRAAEQLEAVYRRYVPCTEASGSVSRA